MARQPYLADVTRAGLRAEAQAGYPYWLDVCYLSGYRERIWFRSALSVQAFRILCAGYLTVTDAGDCLPTGEPT